MADRDALCTVVNRSSGSVGAEVRDGEQGAPKNRRAEQVGEVIMHKEFIFIC